MEGRVYLVGAGPGDPDLLTVKAARVLGEADSVVYDRLVSDAVLSLAPPDAARIYVGKITGKHHLPQKQINEMLVRLAWGGQRVVRLKGGDPFIFGRGGEEALELALHGIPFEIVPGVTAATACAAYAGIPLTHRGLARGVQFVTGHCKEDEPLELDWASLADPDTTLAIYMGLANLGELRDRLVEAGLACATPAAIVESGTTRRQRRIVTTLGLLPETAARDRVVSPAMVVVGRVVGLSHLLAWFDVDIDAQRHSAAGQVVGGA